MKRPEAKIGWKKMIYVGISAHCKLNQKWMNKKKQIGGTLRGAFFSFSSCDLKQKWTHKKQIGIF